MAYGDSIRTAYATMDSVASLLDGLAVAYQQSTTSSVISTASTSYVAYTSASVTVTVATGEIVIVHGQIGASNSNSGNTVTADIYEDGVIVTTGFGATAYMARGNTGGFDVPMPLFVIRAPAAGAHTYSIYWKTSANTAYSVGHVLAAIVVQNT